MTTKISYAIALMLGLGMIFLGARFFVNPEVATAGFGIHYKSQDNYSLHYIKGIKDIFSRLIICVFVLLNERRALVVTLSGRTLIPFIDMAIVLSKSYNGVLQALPHIIAIIVCFVA